MILHHFYSTATQPTSTFEHESSAITRLLQHNHELIHVIMNSLTVDLDHVATKRDHREFSRTICGEGNHGKQTSALAFMYSLFPDRHTAQQRHGLAWRSLQWLVVAGLGTHAVARS